ncbi:1633_t:CDS:1, partial [Paraglomus occultum]
GLIGEADLLSLIPPSLGYADLRKSAQTSAATYSHIPIKVVQWVGFENDVNSMAARLNNDPQYPNPTFEQYSRVTNEEAVRRALSSNVLRKLDILGSRRNPPEEFNDHSAMQEITGEPDFILCRYVSDQNVIPLIAVEVKTKWVLSFPPGNLISKYNTEEARRQNHQIGDGGCSPLHPVKQIYGYLGHNCLQYGVLTTYNQSWFLRRPSEPHGNLYISPAIAIDNVQPTLLQCFAYLILLAHAGHTSIAPLSSPALALIPDEPPSKRRRGNRGSRGSRKPARGSGSGTGSSKGSHHQVAGGRQCSSELPRTMKLQLNDFDRQSVLGDGRSGKVFRAIWQKEEVALKICDLSKHPDYEEEMLTEVEVYYALEDLQGHYIPKLKAAGYAYGKMFFLVATEIVGSPVKVDSLNDQERHEIIKALSQIHVHGFLHRDIRAENILFQLSN